MQVARSMWTHLFTQRLRPQVSAIGIPYRNAGFRWWRNSIFACVRPVVAKDNDSVRGAFPCFLYVVPKVIVLIPNEIQDDEYGSRRASMQESRQEPHACPGWRRKERYGNVDGGGRQRQGSKEPTNRSRQPGKNAQPPTSKAKWGPRHVCSHIAGRTQSHLG